MTTYTVTLRFQYPAWDERDGIPYEVSAASKSKAIARARTQAERDGHIRPCCGKGRYTFTAREIEA